VALPRSIPRRLFVSFCVALAGGSALAATAQESRAPPIEAAPAFTAAQLLAPPTTGWLTNGGTLYNQRYSPLALINRDNVAGLKALWRTAMGSGTTPGHGGQAQILAHEGVLYVSNGANDVFAIDVESGAFREIYTPDQIRDVSEFINRVLAVHKP
jgi:glucose dehydrogenase